MRMEGFTPTGLDELTVPEPTVDGCSYFDVRRHGIFSPTCSSTGLSVNRLLKLAPKMAYLRLQVRRRSCRRVPLAAKLQRDSEAVAKEGKQVHIPSPDIKLYKHDARRQHAPIDGQTSKIMSGC